MFDIQLFADTVTSSTVLQIKNVFTDGDTRTFDVPSPRNDVTDSDVVALDTWIKANNVLIGDKADAPFDYIEYATKIETNRVKVDVSAT